MKREGMAQGNGEVQGVTGLKAPDRHAGMVCQKRLPTLFLSTPFLVLASFDFYACLIYCDGEMKKAAWFFWGLVGLVWLVVSLPFTDYSPISLFDIPDGPPRFLDGLWKLMENIIYAGNFSIPSIFLFYGLNRGWYLGNGYPNCLRSLNLQERFTRIFDNKIVCAATSVVLAVLALVSSLLLFLHGRILGRGLGYW